MQFVSKSGVSVMVMVVCAALVAAGIAGARATDGDGGRVNRTRDGVGILGFDAVAYFDGAPMKGKVEIAYTYQETRYHFANAANRDRFAKNPARYLPQYGGFCAWAVSRGYTAKIDPLAWKIVADRLYLNYSMAVQKMWERDVQGNIRQADANWPGIR
jgi:YHS domain-containing protein